MSAELGDLASAVRGRLGRVHEHHAVLGSTNDRALEWLRDAAPDGAVVTADAQTEGRGRRGRRWESPPGSNLYVSVIVRPSQVREDFSALALVVGLALAEAIGAPQIRLKWPNDLLIGDRKVAGVLCESRFSADAAAVVVGFGINVGQETFDETLADRATSLWAEGLEHERRGLLVDILANLEAQLDRFFAAGFGPLKDAYLARSIVGDRVTATRGGLAIEGVASEVDDSGALWIDTDDAGRVRITAGDVERLRSA